jgi:hypothetical protein
MSVTSLGVQVLRLARDPPGSRRITRTGPDLTELVASPSRVGLQDGSELRQVGDSILLEVVMCTSRRKSSGTSYPYNRHYGR